MHFCLALDRDGPVSYARELKEADIVRICVLASSSSGNCSFIATSRTRILVDAGLSRKETFERMAAIGEDPERIDGILITHEHSDHISGLISLAKKLQCPLYISRLTAPAIPWGDFQPKIEHFQAGGRISIGDIEVDSFTVPHDAVDPVGFTLRAEGVRIGIVTDLGYVAESIKIHLRGVDVLLLEANHDLEMLKVGPYPWSVKQRVMGRMGHLSNEVACDFIRRDLDASVHMLILGHLSESNNHPEIVRSMAARALEGRALFTQFVVAEPRLPTRVFNY
jgi:phosphoribosyl 1,2-cyclic phosphodiesterase